MNSRPGLRKQETCVSPSAPILSIFWRLLSIEKGARQWSALNGLARSPECVPRILSLPLSFFLSDAINGNIIALFLYWEAEREHAPLGRVMRTGGFSLGRDAVGPKATSSP